MHKWLDIAEDYKKSTLILGNGASCAVDKSFSYASLLKVAQENKFISKDTSLLFERFKTSDFEKILRILDDASTVCEVLKPKKKVLKKFSYSRASVRDSLIKSVRYVHQSSREKYNEVKGNIIHFCESFKLIFSINYDILLYWAMMDRNDPNKSPYRFKDCFLSGKFDYESKTRSPENSTIVFYPHGHLMLITHDDNVESKIHADGGSLIDAIDRQWQSRKVRPLFVSEGSTEEKLLSIMSSEYLRTVYNEMKSLKDKVVIYGWSLGDADRHLLNALSESAITHIAISIHPDSNAASAMQQKNYLDAKKNQIISKISFSYEEKNKKKPEIIFFNANSPGCWCHPKES